MTIEQIRPARTGQTDTVSYRQVYHRRIARKILAEFSHERALSPVETGPGRYVVGSADGRTDYHFRAEVLSLESWAIEESSLRRVRDGEELPVDAVALVVDLAPMLGIGPQALPEYLEEFINTVAISADRPDERRITAADLAHADFQSIERTMTEGHPCIVANAGRLGFSADDIDRYAPEVGNHFRLVWVAARREDCDVATVSGVELATTRSKGRDSASAAARAAKRRKAPPRATSPCVLPQGMSYSTTWKRPTGPSRRPRRKAPARPVSAPS